MAKYKTYANIGPEQEVWWRKGELPNLCMSLRMATSGASDPWQDEEVDSLLAYLHHRLNHWEPTMNNGHFFDATVKMLVEATVMEVEARRKA